MTLVQEDRKYTLNKKQKDVLKRCTRQEIGIYIAARELNEKPQKIVNMIASVFRYQAKRGKVDVDALYDSY